MPTKKEVEKKTNEIMKYANQLVGIPYVWWTGCNDRDDFHYYDDPKDIKFVKKHGVACSGFVNLLMHKANITFPKSQHTNRGGTWFWFNYWKKKGKVREFDYTKKYPVGTILYRRWRNVKDQGHFAVLHSYNKKHPNCLLYGNIIHAYPYDNKKGGQVGISSLGVDHFYNYNTSHPEGYYEYVVLPKDWLY